MRNIPRLKGKTIKTLRPAVRVYTYSGTGRFFHTFCDEVIVGNRILVGEGYLDAYISLNGRLTNRPATLDMKDEETKHTICLLLVEG